MANLNEWKTVFLRNKKIFDKYYPEMGYIDEIERSRFGFYLFILGTMFDIESKKEMEEYIIDTQFNLKVLGCKANDNKIDCLYIDDEDKKIYFMNFKYREKYKENKNFEYDEIDSTVNFLTLVNDEEYKSENLNNKKLENYFNKIREIMSDTSQIYDIYFYFISNEDKGFADEIIPRIKSLEKNNGVFIKSLSLDDIYNMGNSKMISTDAELLIENDKLSLFKNDNYTTNNSYVLNMSLFELLRITCDNEDYRISNELKTHEDFDLTTFCQEKSQLRDNVRSFLGLTNYNKNIKKTLQLNAKDFFYYNNGITIVCNDINTTEAKSNKLYKIQLKDIQIVNGGQTISTLFNIVAENDVEELLYKLKNTYILVRLFNISNNDELRLNIAQYTNSQNSIDNIDLKSVDRIQLEIEEYFKPFGVDYIRKRGILSDNNNSIKMITLAQLIYSFKGYPDRATNQKKRLFDEYYEYIFLNDFDLESAKMIYDIHFKITNTLEKNKMSYEYSEIYYIIYVISSLYDDFNDLSKKGIANITDDLILKIIDFIKVHAKRYTQELGNTFAQSRVFVKKGFKEYINENLKNVFE